MSIQTRATVSQSLPTLPKKSGVFQKRAVVSPSSTLYRIISAVSKIHLGKLGLQFKMARPLMTVRSVPLISCDFAFFLLFRRRDEHCMPKQKCERDPKVRSRCAQGAHIYLKMRSRCAQGALKVRLYTSRCAQGALKVRLFTSRCAQGALKVRFYTSRCAQGALKVRL